MFDPIYVKSVIEAMIEAISGCSIIGQKNDSGNDRGDKFFKSISYNLIDPRQNLIEGDDRAKTFLLDHNIAPLKGAGFDRVGQPFFDGLNRRTRHPIFPLWLMAVPVAAGSEKTIRKDEISGVCHIILHNFHFAFKKPGFLANRCDRCGVSEHICGPILSRILCARRVSPVVRVAGTSSRGLSMSPFSAERPWPGLPSIPRGQKDLKLCRS